MKKKIIINLSAIIFCIVPTVAQIFIFYIAPVLYGIYNFVVCRNVKDMVKMYAISLFSQLIGLSLAEYFMYIASSDYADFLETPAILVINIIVTLFIDIVLLIIKFLKNKHDKKVFQTEQI